MARSDWLDAWRREGKPTDPDDIIRIMRNHMSEADAAAILDQWMESSGLPIPPGPTGPTGAPSGPTGAPSGPTGAPSGPTGPSLTDLINALLLAIQSGDTNAILQAWLALPDWVRAALTLKLQGTADPTTQLRRIFNKLTRDIKKAKTVPERRAIFRAVVNDLMQKHFHEIKLISDSGKNETWIAELRNMINFLPFDEVPPDPADRWVKTALRSLSNPDKLKKIVETLSLNRPALNSKIYHQDTLFVYTGNRWVNALTKKDVDNNRSAQLTESWMAYCNKRML